MSGPPSKIEVVVTSLSNLEKELDMIKIEVNDARRQMISTARQESQRQKEKSIQEANKSVEKKLADSIEANEKEADKSISKAEQDVKALKKKIDSKFDDAVSSVLKSLIGE